MLAIVEGTFAWWHVVVETTTGAKVGVVDVHEASREETTVRHGHVGFLIVFFWVRVPGTLTDDVTDRTDVGAARAIEG